MSRFSLTVLQANPFYFSLAAFHVFKNLLLLLIASQLSLLVFHSLYSAFVIFPDSDPTNFTL